MSNNYQVIKDILDTEDPEKIRTTVENFQLVEMPNKIVEYITAKLLTDDNGVKDTITRVLSNNKNLEIPKYLVPYISSEKISTRNLAGEILLNRKDESIEAMINYLPDVNDDDQKFIIDILGLIGSSKPAFEIISILKYTRNNNVLLACIEALGNIKSEIGIDEIINLYETDELFRPTIIEALGKIGTPICIDFINKKYYGVDELTKYSLIESLGDIGNIESFNMLVNDIQNLDSAYKWVAIETIGKLEQKFDLELPSNSSLKNALLDTLTSADLQYKKSAVNLISKFDDEQILIHVLSIYGNDEEIDNKLKDYFISNLTTLFKNISDYLKKETENLKDIIGLIKEMIQYDGGISLQSLDELEIHPLIENFTVQLNHPDEDVRASSMELLFFLDVETALIFSDTMLEDSVSWNRMRLLEIIQYGEDPKIIEIIRSLAKDEDEMVSENATAILNERGINHIEFKDNQC